MTIKKPKFKMNAGHVEYVLRKHLNHIQNTIIPEAAVAHTSNKRKAYRADYIMVSKAGYATEFEVKVTMADWKADLVKGKWQNMPNWISRFIYVVPASLGVPDWVPKHHGIWHVHNADNMKRAYIEVIRAPKMLHKEKVPTAIVDKWISNLYYRYWQMRMIRDRSIISQQTGNSRKLS